MTERAISNRVSSAIGAVLPRGAAVEVSSRRGRRSSLVAKVRAGRFDHRLVVAWAGEGWPADVAAAIESVPDADVVVARDLSVGAREALDRRDIGWVDEAGRANVMLRSGLVLVRDVRDVGDVRDSPRPARESRASTGTWTTSAIAVGEAILSGVEPCIGPIEEATGLSRGATANALAMLERRGVLDRPLRGGPGSGRRLVNGPGLLDEYANAVATIGRKSVPLMLHRLFRDPLATLAEELAPALDRYGATWAATGAAAGALLAPYLSTVASIELYVDPRTMANRADLCAALGARPVDGGHRIELRPLSSRISFTGPVVSGVRCAPPARVYADLRARGGRSAEAAHHLQEVLGVGASP